MMQLTFLLRDVSRFSSFPNKTPKMVDLHQRWNHPVPDAPEPGLPSPILWPVGFFISKFQRDEARRNVGVLQVRKQR